MSESQFQLGFKKNQSQLELKQQADAKADAEIRVAACVACLAVLEFAEVLLRLLSLLGVALSFAISFAFGMLSLLSLARLCFALLVCLLIA